MSVEEIKRNLATMSAAERGEITAYLFHLRSSGDSQYQAALNQRLSDRDPAHWLSLEEFEQQLDVKD